jgi:inosose dehydratase
MSATIARADSGGAVDGSRRELLSRASRLAALAAMAPAASALAFATSAAVETGCAAITWGGDDARAIDDVAALGYRGIQLRRSAVDKYGSRPKELGALLGAKRLSFVALSSGDVSVDPARAKEELAMHARHAAFLREAGGRYLQLIDVARGKEGPQKPDDFKRLGAHLTEIGRRAKDAGVAAGYHHHMGSLGQSPEEVERVMEALDPKYVRLVLDVAHYHQGGGDPAEAIRKYRGSILFLHIKDVEPTPDGGYRFVELGRGRVDLASVFRALDETQFRGWAIVELDAVPDSRQSPKEAAAESKRYIETKLGRRV